MHYLTLVVCFYIEIYVFKKNAKKFNLDLPVDSQFHEKMISSINAFPSFKITWCEFATYPIIQDEH